MDGPVGRSVFIGVIVISQIPHLIFNILHLSHPLGITTQCGVSCKPSLNTKSKHDTGERDSSPCPCPGPVSPTSKCQWKTRTRNFSGREKLNNKLLFLISFLFSFQRWMGIWKPERRRRWDETILHRHNKSYKVSIGSHESGTRTCFGLRGFGGVCIAFNISPPGSPPPFHRELRARVHIIYSCCSNSKRSTQFALILVHAPLEWQSKWMNHLTFHILCKSPYSSSCIPCWLMSVFLFASKTFNTSMEILLNG